MAKLEYSREALGVLNKFHRCDAIVYVEGDDDEFFWRVVFQRCANMKIEPKSMGGSASLDAQIRRIVDEDLPVLAARDADFLMCTGKTVSDKRIVYTWGYSIENTLYTTSSVSTISQSWTRGRNGDLHEECQEWFETLGSRLRQLVVLDAANFLHNLGCDVLGEGFARFSDGASSCMLDGKKIAAHEKAVGQKISAVLASTVNVGKDAMTWIRGHFLQSAVMTFLQEQGKKSGVNKKPSYSGLYAEAMQYLSHHLKSGHPHYRHYRRAATAAAAALRARAQHSAAAVLTDGKCAP